MGLVVALEAQEINTGRFTCCTCVKIDGETLTITESNKKTVRWPGERDNIKRENDNSLTWRYGKFSFKVEGINIKLMGADYAYAATTYRNEHQIPVIRINGENLITRIGVHDTEGTDG